MRQATRNATPREGRPFADAATLPDLLRAAAETDAGFTIVDGALQERAKLAYSELADRAARGAATLQRHDVERGDRVCLLALTSAELLAGIFAVWWAGAVPVVLALPRRRSELPEYVEDLHWRLDHADAKALVTGEPFTGMLADADVNVTTLPLDELEGAEQAEPADIEGEDLAVLQFTSGSTGRSRAVALTHASVLANLASLSEAVAVERDRDVLVSWLPLFHDMGLVLTLGAVANAVPLILQPTEEFLGRPGSWLEAVSKYHGTATVAPNFAYGLATRDLERNPRSLDLSSLRVAGNGAEPIDMEVFDRFHEVAEPLGLKREALAPMYGLAEATVGVAITRPEEGPREMWVARDRLEADATAEPTDPGDEARRLVCCGTPLPDMEIVIRSEERGELGPCEVGEICVRGPSLMDGYWRDDEATDETLRDGWLHTGDLGYLDGDDLYICGRIKDMIIVGGRNLYPEDYEQVAMAVDGVRRGNALAFGLPDTERMVVVAETKAGQEQAQDLAAELMKTMAERLTHAPAEVVLVRPQTLPKTSSGKLQRRACRSRYLEGDLPAIASAKR
jgi:fatty-acyl-CoA synthase